MAPDFAGIARDGAAALQRGDATRARLAFEQVVAANRATPQLLVMLAQACAALGDETAEEAALDRVLAAEPRHLTALILKGNRVAARGDDRGATSYYQLALANAPMGTTLPPEQIARLRHAEAAVDAANRRFRAHLDAEMGAAGRDNPRFVEALEILEGSRPVYLQQPTNFYYPRLPNIAFYEREDFAWVAALEAAVPTMRAELEAAIQEDAGFQPYVEAVPGRPNRGHALLDDPRWSAFYLWRDSEAVQENIARCPATMAALAHAPIPRIVGRSPMALFSVLRANTHIPPHNGMLNTRLICHVPLIVPDGCRLRVGGETRAVELGKAMIFDDSIEHEAWNDSGETRVVLLFEVWRPEVSGEERRALTVLFEAIASYPSA